jgi:serine/threonine-protein kinase RsbW
LANHHVVLTVPAQPEFLRVVRMTASGLGSRLGFNIDEVDDLRLALDELCFALIGKGTEGELKLTYVLEEHALVITGEIAKETSAASELNDLSRQILSALVDEHELSDGATTRRFSLTKRQLADQRR